MFSFDDDKTIHVTRGDMLYFSVSAMDEVQDEIYTFQPGDIVRISIYEAKNSVNVFVQKDFLVSSPTEEVDIFLGASETIIGEPIDKATAYWYEIVLNPGPMEQTIIGNDADGAKVIMLYPEGGDITEGEPEEPEKDIGNLDSELDPFSERAVKNSAVARAVLALNSAINVIRARITNFTSLKDGSTTGDAELMDIRVDMDGNSYASAGEAVRAGLKNIRDEVTKEIKDFTESEEVKAMVAEMVTEAFDSSLLDILGNGVEE